MPETHESPGYQLLVDILTQAVTNGADAVELEYDSGHSLEVCFMVGNAGAGYALDRDAASNLIDSLWEEKKKGHGKFASPWTARTTWSRSRHATTSAKMPTR